jgi:hypothetical protein
MIYWNIFFGGSGLFMAGWKLRKDKTAEETPGDTLEAAAPTGAISPEEPMTDEPIFLDTLPGPLPDFAAPDFELDNDPHFTSLDFDSDKEEEPLTLVDYSEPDSETSPPPSQSTGARVFAMPPPAAPDDFPSAPDDFQERLRTGRYDVSEMASPLEMGFGSGIPEVAPFVLDTPPAAPPLPAPQLVVQIGRLAAAFPLTKEVTTIGRPDSPLHYYPDVEIELDDAVSRRHAEVIQRADGYFLVDTGSSNGTLLNGEKLPPQQERLLAHGDRIRIGDRTEIIFE